MKTILSVLALFFAAFIFSASVQADGLTPSDELVCNVLQGGTPGLFGLCNAYCEAKDCDSYPEDDQPRSCSRLLDNYNDRATPEDGPMPCLIPDEPEFECPCWTNEDLAVVGMLVDDGHVSPSTCKSTLIGGIDDQALYTGSGLFINFVVRSLPDFGFYNCSSVGTSGMSFSTLDEETAEGCVMQVQDLHELDFTDPVFDCTL